MKIGVPELSLVLLIGASGSGKSTFAKKHFLPTEVISSDYCRALVSDDENNQAATADAFEVLRFIAGKRLAGGLLTVIDATNVRSEDRKVLIDLAREYHVLAAGIVFDMSEKVCNERNAKRTDRNFGPHVIPNQIRNLRKSHRNLDREGLRYVYTLTSPEKVEEVSIERQPLWTNKKHLHGPFDIIGDIHGCFDELVQLLGSLGYTITPRDSDSVDHAVEPRNSDNADGTVESHNSGTGGLAIGGYTVTTPEGRMAFFVGDLVDRSPKTPEVLELVMDMVESGTALCVPGNHDVKLVKALLGKKVQISHGLAESLEQLATRPPEFSQRVLKFLDGLVSHYVLDDGKLVVAHAGMKAEYQGRASGGIREFALYGETTGETDEFGLPVRYNWAGEYRGKAKVVYGHTPVPEAEWLNNTINIDTGCVFGGKLTALRYPEGETVSVPAAQVYAQPGRPFLPADAGDAPSLGGASGAAGAATLRERDDTLDLADVAGKRIVSTRLKQNVTIREENSIVALEHMSRFAADPRWLVYLPPTMSPSETSHKPGLLEHPAEAFAYYREHGVAKVVCEEKHMGSRAVLIVCRDESVAQRRFGISGDGSGICYTRTGRRFFTDTATEQAFIDRVRKAVDASGLWEELETDWLCLDCELMPWSAKAQELLRQQYGPVGTAAQTALAASVDLLTKTAARDPSIAGLLEHFSTRKELADLYVASYQRYIWPVNSLDDYKLAPFHLLASEGKVHTGRDHIWHMDTLARLATDPIIVKTPYMVIDLTDTESQNQGITWWQTLTAKGGEGMVVKPFDFISKDRRGIVQPAVKCRGPEYLRIIYGPEYTLPENLERLRNRGLSGKRSLALREFALGVESLERFVRREPLYRVHECVFGVLALESEPVDPRL